VERDGMPAKAAVSVGPYSLSIFTLAGDA